MDLITPGYGLLIWQLSGLVLLGFWVYALFDCLKNDFRGPNQKLIWVILVVFVPVIGTILYLSMSRSTVKKNKFSLNSRSTSNK